jgi:hypothetical protein
MRNHRDIPEDPDIQMRAIRVEFSDPKHNYATNINGTRREIGEYFSQGPVNVGQGGKDNLQMPQRIVFLDLSIVMDLEVV